MTGYETSIDPRTGNVNAETPVSTATEVEVALARAGSVAPMIAATAPSTRACWLRAIADSLDDPEIGDELVELAESETALGTARLRGELTRTAAQLRFYAEVAAEGSYLDVALDHPAGPNPALARMQVPLGPVAVFGASNFPFAFSVLGNDTASALAAGCPVLVKGHPAHPQLSRRLAEVAAEALDGAGAPQGVFALVTGFDAGTALVRAPETAAVAFTGSEKGGMALRDLANRREVVIPVFAEMGTVNPVVVTPEGGSSVSEIAHGFVASFTMGAGQFCTKPGLLFAPAGCGAASAVGEALRTARPRAWALTQQIAGSAARGLDELIAAGADVVASVPGPEGGWSVDATVLSVPIAEVTATSRFTQECFGPVAIVTEYSSLEELRAALLRLQGALAASVMPGPGNDPDVATILTWLTPLAGRVTVGDWPTGVAFTWAQQHGGPWPATSNPGATSVGAAALGRFTRPVSYQSVPQAALPEALREDNPWGLPRRVNGRCEVPG